MNIAIVGGRDFNDYTLLKESILAYIDAHEKPENIVSGGAKGADSRRTICCRDEHTSPRFQTRLPKVRAWGNPCA